MACVKQPWLSENRVDTIHSKTQWKPPLAFDRFYIYQSSIFSLYFTINSRAHFLPSKYIHFLLFSFRRPFCVSCFFFYISQLGTRFSPDFTKVRKMRLRFFTYIFKRSIHVLCVCTPQTVSYIRMISSILDRVIVHQLGLS